VKARSEGSQDSAFKIRENIEKCDASVTAKKGLLSCKCLGRPSRPPKANMKLTLSRKIFFQHAGTVPQEFFDP
jgi:hypothetical protein